MLQLKDIAYEIEGKSILQSIQFSLEKGEILVITGPNGSGKSTLAKVIMGIVRPAAGQIILNGRDITDESVTDRAKSGIGYAFQQPPRFKGVTVYKLLEIAAGRQVIRKECCDTLSKVGICSKDYLTRQVDASLSGGEIKRIEIAIQLMRKSDFVIFDEPEAGIDLWSFNMLVDTFKELKAKKDQGIIIISHQEKIIEMADKMMILEEGKIKDFGEREDILPKLKGEILTTDRACHVN